MGLMLIGKGELELCLGLMLIRKRDEGVVSGPNVNWKGEE